MERINDLTITVTHVFTQDRALSFHVTSFIKIADGKISGIDEYWGDDAPPPAWRKELRIGRTIPR